MIVWPWIWLIVTALLIVFGSFMATDQWHDYKLMRWLPHWLGTIVGLIVIGIATLASTYFWNEITAAQQQAEERAKLEKNRLAILQAVMTELVANRSRLATESFMESDPKKLEQITYYPRMQEFALSNAITCGLFIGDEDRRLFTAIYMVHDRLSVINSMVARMEGSPISTVVAVKQVREVLRELGKAACIEHDQLAEILRAHGVSTTQKIFVPWQDEKKPHTRNNLID